MRKLIAIPLLVLYITAVSGMMIQLHFCGDKLLSWNVNEAKPTSCCGEAAGAAAPEKSDKQDCCKDKTITLKIKQEQNRANQLQMQLSALLSVAVLPSYAVPQAPGILPAGAHSAYRANAPPGLWQNIPLYKLHTRFTYYG